MKDIYGHEIPVIEEEIMKHFDTIIRSEFGDTAAILEEAHEDLAADNAAAAKAEYGRGPDIPFVTLENLRKARDRLHTLVKNNDYSKTTLLDSVKAELGSEPMVMIQAETLNNLISAWDRLENLLRISSCIEEKAVTDWGRCVRKTKEDINDQS